MKELISTKFKYFYKVAINIKNRTRNNILGRKGKVEIIKKNCESKLIEAAPTKFICNIRILPTFLLKQWKCLSCYQGLQTCVYNFKVFITTSHNNVTLLICSSFQFLLVVLLRFWLFSSHFQMKMNVFRFLHEDFCFHYDIKSFLISISSKRHH